MGSFWKMGFLFLLCRSAGIWEEEAPKYKDPKQPLDVRIDDLLSRMTLAEKIGQMMQIERKVATSDVIQKFFVGSVLTGGGMFPKANASALEWATIVDGIQKAALSTRLAIPIIYGTDAIHGHNNVYKATIFPHNIGLGATRDPALVKKIGAATALEVRATGMSYTFGPCIAVCRDPRWGRCYESYGEVPELVQEMTDAIIPGLQGDIPVGSPKGVPFVAGTKKLASCAKHYVGDGGTYKGINENNTVIDFHGLLSIHMPPFYNAISHGTTTIMASLSSWNGVKSHTDKFLLTDILKKRLRFRGFVITDWQGIDKIRTPPHANYSVSIKEGITAGIDMVMIPYSYAEFAYELTALVENKLIPISRIDDAVRRILRVKFTMGLFEHPYSDRSLLGEVGKQEHRDLAREAVRKSLVLLKNGKPSGDPVLPLLKKAKKILVAGTHADDLGYQCGGWTISFQGRSGNNYTVGTTILTAIKSAVDPTTEVVFSEAPEESWLRSRHFDYAVVAIGEPPYAETKGDNLNLTIPEPGLSTMQNVCKQVKCVVLIISGRPVVVQPYLHMIDALVAAWLPGTEGVGVTDVLFGDFSFSGKLPSTWFKSIEQLPMNYGDPHYDPLFPFGFGLTTQPTKQT